MYPSTPNYHTTNYLSSLNSVSRTPDCLLCPYDVTYTLSEFLFLFFYFNAAAWTAYAAAYEYIINLLIHYKNLLLFEIVKVFFLQTVSLWILLSVSNTDTQIGRAHV